MAILREDRHVQTKRVAKLLQVLRTRAFTEHLLNRIARNEVREQEDHGDDDPKRGNGEQKLERKAANHFRRRPLTDAAAARVSSWTDAGDSEGEAIPCAGGGSGLIFTRETRRRSISITVKRYPPDSKLSPPRGINPRRLRTK